jgi:hypothetical protein
VASVDPIQALLSRHQVVLLDGGSWAVHIAERGSILRFTGLHPQDGKHSRKTMQRFSLYRWLPSWGEEYLAYGECGEGIRRARALIADCHYRIACIWEKERQWKRAIVEFERYLAMRKDRHGSIYALRDVKLQYEEVLGKVRR